MNTRALASLLAIGFFSAPLLPGCLSSPPNNRQDDVTDGVDGAPGADGTSCSVTTDSSGCAVVTCMDGTISEPICSGSNGTDGSNGQDGQNGDNGLDGTSCTVAQNGDCAVVTCEDGSEAEVCDGDDGQNGTSCSVNTNADGCAIVSCTDGSTSDPICDGEDGVDGDNGLDGTSCTVAQNGDCAVVTCPDGTDATVCDGEDGQDGDDATPAPTCTTRYYLDADGDTYGVNSTGFTACEQPTGYVSTTGDCNDGDKAIYPNATELCNGKDDDCDGQIDDGLNSNTYYRDYDGDGYGSVTFTSCSLPTVGYVTIGGDCSDYDASVHPGAIEICNGEDDNCNGQIDESCFGGEMDQGGRWGCVYPMNSQVNDWLVQNGIPTYLQCNLVDGTTATCTSANLGSTILVWMGASQMLPTSQLSLLLVLDQTDACESYSDGILDTEDHDGIDGGFSDGDFDDNATGNGPNKTEICGDLLDQDGDGSVDESCWVDSDGDGYTPLQGDCNDATVWIGPAADEMINGQDDNCNGIIDEDDD